MVTITGYALRESKKEAGKTFVSLQLQGDIEMVQSMDTGRFYATAKKCSITSTFSEEVAKNLIGSRMPGTIERVQCDPYDYTVPETGEVVSLAHSYQYVPEQPTTFVEPQRQRMVSAF
ncbi:hypothetical protein [Segetibacter koreensis]|uniref:hypothetical protein n=1 Tax=Segetibacter koreensis TaxID=398037 RepID=UPI0003828722|nr:hypothetical protein [Segetibacter koreensis]